MVVAARNCNSTIGSLPTRGLFGHCLLVALLVWISIPNKALAASEAHVVVPDILALPGEEVFVEACLYRDGLMSLVKPGIQGELLRVLDQDGNLLRSLLTGPSGSVRIRYKTEDPGRYPFTVHLAENPRFHAVPSTGSVMVRSAALPLFFVLIEGGLMAHTPLTLLGDNLKQAAPFRNSPEKLQQIALCRTIVYLSLLSRSHTQQVRLWLENGMYPHSALFLLELPLTAGLSEDSVPDLVQMLSLWKDRAQPAYLVTGKAAYAESAGQEGVHVFLLTEEDEPDISPTENKDHGNRISFVQEWAEIPEPCNKTPKNDQRPEQEGEIEDEEPQRSYQ